MCCSSMMYSILFPCIITGVLVFASVVNAKSTKGTPGVDYPNYNSIPVTSFKCSEQKYIPGFYADLETNCQAFHFCFKNNQESFLCPTGTTFNQEKLACDSWFASNCSLAPLFYKVNDGPAMKSAGKKLPMLLKLRNRAHDQAKVTTSVYETLSSLYEGSADSKPISENVETSNFSLNTNESDKNDTDETISEESSVEEVELENGEPLLLERSGLPLEGLQTDSSEEESFEETIMYDPVTDDYFAAYASHPVELQEDPENEVFRNFYENVGGNYGPAFQDFSNYWGEENSEAVEESDTSDLNYGDAMDASEFSKRRLVEHQFIPYRRRPTYVVLEDEDSEFPRAFHASVAEDESDLHSSEYVTVETEEASEFPLGDGTTESGEVFDTTERIEDQELREQQYRTEYSTEKPLTSEEFNEAILTEIAYPQGFSTYPEGYEFDENEGKLIGGEGFQPESEQMDGEEMKDQPVYELDGDSISYEPDSLRFSDKSQDSDYYVNADKDLYETEESRALDDTYVVIPDESDADSASLTDVEIDGTEDNPLNEYTLDEMDPNEQMDAPKGKERDAYAYYKLFKDHPEYDELVDPTRKAYESQFTENIYYEPMTESGYPFYSPAFAREAFFDFVRRNERYQGDKPEENGYADNYYDPYTGQLMEYYGSEEARQYYPRADIPCNKDLAEDAELENQSQVTDEPFMSDLMGSEFQNTEEETMLITDSPDLEETDFSNEIDGQAEETYYVFDFDEDDQKVDNESNMKDSGNETSDFDARSDAGEILKPTFESGEEPSSSTGNISFEEASASNVDFQGNEFGYIPSQSSDEKLADSISKSPADSWSSFIPEDSATDDKTVTTSSALDRLATQLPSFNPVFSGDTGFMNVPFQASMDFGAYGYGPNIGQQYGMLDSMQAGKQMEAFSHRIGENEQPRPSKLSSIQERLRSMKQGKFGVFKKYMKNQNVPM